MQVTELVYPKDTPQRIDVYLAQMLSDLSRSMVAGLIRDGFVQIEGKPVVKSRMLLGGEHIRVQIPAPEPLTLTPEAIPLDIVYEDDWLIVVNKPKGMVVHPAPGHFTGTLVHALLAHCGDSLSGINGQLRPGIVHRIDRMTSGLLVVAKNDSAHRSLAEQLKAHTFEREYEAVVLGVLGRQTGVVDAPIGRDPVKRKQMAVTDKNARQAVTHYERLHVFDKHTHIKLRLETGRTHQIRVHMAYIGHPVLGDEVYSSAKPVRGLEGQCLHARTLGFRHPGTGQGMRFTSQLPDYFQTVLRFLGGGSMQID